MNHRASASVFDDGTITMAASTNHSRLHGVDELAVAGCYSTCMGGRRRQSGRDLGQSMKNQSILHTPRSDHDAT